MAWGLLAAVLTTIAWVLAQVGWMHIRPAQNRFKAMLAGYLASLPLVWVIVRFPAAAPLAARWAEGEASWTPLFHAYLFHLLQFLLYVECFYHVERSVTLRFLVEIQQRDTGAGATFADITGEYNIREMILRRMEVLQENHFVELRDGRWFLKPKGRLFATAMQISTWIFQSDPQSERIQ